MLSIPECRISKAAEVRCRLGHHWIFANELITPIKELPVGGIVKVLSENNHFIDFAFSNPNSLITLRRLFTKSYPDQTWLWKRLDAALDFREKHLMHPIYRLVFAEGDFLSGLTIDRYKDNYVIQITSKAMENYLESIIGWLETKLKPQSIALRNDNQYRKMEGLPLENVILKGELPERFEWSWYGVTMIADLKNGQKTGAYLDQRFHYLLMDQLTKQKRVLDLFCHTAGFGIRAAKLGKDVIAVDSSQDSISLAQEIAKKNHVESRIKFVVEDVNKFLKQNDEKFDVIICDPPSLIKSRKEQKKGEIAYQKLNQRCFQKLNQDGYLVTFSCSHLLTSSELLKLLVKASKGNDIFLYKTLHQPIDHPILLSHPETEYLKGFIFQLRRLV